MIVNADGTYSLLINTEDSVLISIENPFKTIEPMDHQLVLKDGWIQCFWNKATSFITALKIVPGDPFKKDDLQIMDWIQTKDPRKQ
jgi:hypothetical protein